jgi:hypothetical protein
VRTALRLTFLLVAAASGCAAWRPQKLPREIACPERGRVQVVADPDDENASRREVDSNGDGRADELFFVKNDKVERAELDLDYDGETDVWLRYDGRGRPVEWETLPPAARTDAPAVVNSGRLPDDRPPPEVARMIPSLDPPADPDCFDRPEVKAYLRGVKDELYGHWLAPASAREARTVLRFSLDPGGAVVGACVEQADDAAIAASVVRSLLESPSVTPMPDRALCLARHPLLGTFGLETH